MKPPKLIEIRLNETFKSFGDKSHVNDYFSRLLSKCMKLRIRGNSIRLRLTKSEVEDLGKSGKVQDAVTFGAATPEFCYELRTAFDDDQVRAKFDANCLSISIPASAAKNWITSEQISIEEMQPIVGSKSLRILVEKDFACLTERAGEDDTDAFPNPLVEAYC